MSVLVSGVLVPRRSGRWSAFLDRIEPPHRPVRNPLEFCLVVVLAASVAPAALGPEPLPPSLTDAFPRYVAQASATLLFLGCVGVAVGILWRHRDMGIVIQQSAMVLVATSLATYGVAVGAATGWSSQGAYAVGLSLGLAVGFAARIMQFQLWTRRRRRIADAL